LHADQAEKKKSKIYTKTGDYGETSLLGGLRTSKDSLRVEAYGCIDELDSFVGVCIVKNQETDIKSHLIEVQKDLLTIGANLAYPTDLSQASIVNGQAASNFIPHITDDMVRKLEIWIDSYESELPPLKNFIISGEGTEASALLHVARTIARRAERRIVTLKKHEEVHKNILRYLNRLSDYFFTASRLTSKRTGRADLKWQHEDDLGKYLNDRGKK